MPQGGAQKNFEHDAQGHSQWEMGAFPIDSGGLIMYNMLMKRYLILASLAQALTGCAVYTATSIVSAIATDQSVTDHAVSGLVQRDCSSIRVLTGEKDFYCEPRADVGTRYNRNPY